MNLMAYLLVALVAGVSLGTSLGSSLGFLMTARNNRLPESRQCLVFAEAALVLLGCAAVLQAISGSVPVDPLNNALAVVAVAVGLGGASLRCPVRS